MSAIYDGINPKWQQRAAAFHAANPQVYAWLVKYARQLLAAGYRRSSIKLLWNRARWDWTLQTAPTDGFKMNDAFHAWYGRRIMDCEPELAGMFETRQRAGDANETPAETLPPNAG